MVAIAVLAGAAILAAVLDPAPAQLSGRARASDGDSFVLGDERVRLVGIDAPELDQTCTDASGRPWPCGRAARDALARLLPAQLSCAPEGHDQYRRVLAVCHSGQTDIAEAMVGQGLAISSGRYFAAERTARAAGTGIWQGSFETPRNWRDGVTAQAPSPLDWLGDLFR